MQNFRDQDGAIGLLIVLKHGNERAPDREPVLQRIARAAHGADRVLLAAGSVLVSRTVPVYPLATFPNGSNAVTVSLNAVPVVAGWTDAVPLPEFASPLAAADPYRFATGIVTVALL